MNSKAEEKPREELVYTVANLEEASRTYSISENPYYKDSVAQYVEAINTIYGEDATQTVTETTLEQALKDSDVSRLFVEKLLKLQGEDVLKAAQQNLFHLKLFHLKLFRPKFWAVRKTALGRKSL